MDEEKKSNQKKGAITNKVAWHLRPIDITRERVFWNSRKLGGNEDKGGRKSQAPIRTFTHQRKKTYGVGELKSSQKTGAKRDRQIDDHEHRQGGDI